MVQTRFTFELETETLFPVLGKRFEKLIKTGKHNSSIDQAENDFHDLAEPLLVWERFPIESFKDKKVFLEGGASLGGGRLLEIIAGAEEIVTGVCTVGDSLENRAKHQMSGGNSIYGMVLDLLANWGVDNILNQFYHHYRNEIQEKAGFRSSILLNPGHAGWDVSGQGEIFRLVERQIPAGKMKISDSNMLFPVKSQSFFFGIGKKKIGKENGIVCSVCELGGTCLYGRLKAASWKG